MVQSGVIVEMRNVSKSFPGVRALSAVDFTLQKGSVHALVGENGAGKSTLMKILSGTYRCEEGGIILNGKRVDFRSEKEALNAGIAIVPQELSFIPELTIEENIFIGREPTNACFLDKKQRRGWSRRYMTEMGLDLDPTIKMLDISLAQCQMVEIIKAISREAKVIIMDEPTSSLTTVETRQLFRNIKRLKESGIAIIYISHKLEEVFELCDMVTVLRDSYLIGSLPVAEADQDSLITMMVGREIGDIYPELDAPGTEEMLRVEGFTQPGVFDNISFTVRRGEVLGFSGMVGAGRSELMRALFGMDRHSLGQIWLDGTKVVIRSPTDAIRAGIGMVTEDRAATGFIPDMSVSQNIVLPNTDIFAPRGFLKNRVIDKKVMMLKEKLGIKVPSVHDKIINLSGGNQQKVVLSKWLVRNIKILIMDEPTRGIDIGAKQEIYRLIRELSASGMAVIMISSEMQEVIELSHRIAVMDGGKIIKIFDHEEVSQDKIMQTIIEGGRR